MSIMVGSTGGVFAGRLGEAETALVAEGLGKPGTRWPRTLAELPVLSALASKFLAVATPRSLGLIAVGSAAEDVVAYQSAWAAPRDIRVVGEINRGQAARGWKSTNVEHALAADVVVIGADAGLPTAQLPELVRKGTHLTYWAPSCDLLAPLLPFCTLTVDRIAHPRQASVLAEVVAGLVDGRVLDEITVLHLPIS